MGQIIRYWDTYYPIEKENEIINKIETEINANFTKFYIQRQSNKDNIEVIKKEWKITKTKSNHNIIKTYQIKFKNNGLSHPSIQTIQRQYRIIPFYN
jgi:hypothetical protein